MILAIDVHYLNDQAFGSALSFTQWNTEQPEDIYHTQLAGIADYEPGQFYKRELPCILQLLEEHKLLPEIIIIDGYVMLGESRAGLGSYLYKALKQQVKIIGVAKRAFIGISEDSKILRGASQNPLFISSLGLELDEAKSAILKMHGVHRLPTLLKLVDSLCREQAKQSAEAASDLSGVSN
ncbi:endonuclease V [uncultured Thiothrix sp.]|uniref:endonuclease V n=1 Tax=uncultured Thiothrix sp. TaxID=223185 RepID=UPI002609F567|nr:endonuclease V [uncultured Thiothrix sp.]